MKHNLTRLILALVVAAPCLATAQAPYRTDAATELERGKAMYNTGNYAGCADVMRALLRNTETEALQEEIEYYIVMSCVKSGNERVPAQLAAFLKSIPCRPDEPKCAWHKPTASIIKANMTRR